MRSCRRLMRTWVFIVGAVLVCAMWYLQVLESSSWPSAPTGWDHDEMSARYRGATMLNTFVAMFSFGIIFLAFDIQARDTQNRMREVMDSQPVSNIEVIVGRVTGIILLLLIPCVVFVSLVGCYESISLIFGVRYRMGFQPMYVISFVVWNIIPNLLFWGAFVACLAVLVRIRVLCGIDRTRCPDWIFMASGTNTDPTAGEFVAVPWKCLVPVRSRTSFCDSYDCG